MFTARSTLLLSIFVCGLVAACDTDHAVPPTCEDGVQNGSEEGTDCGGACRSCEVAPTCSDGVHNGDEAGVDCGGACGACGPACDDGMHNGDEAGVDCGGSCAPCPASCDDGVHNGGEDGVDCGGGCAPCPSCTDRVHNGDEQGVDCGGACGACPTCSDGRRNGTETGVDCGGECPASCPTCSDGVRNGSETGVDCGGSCVDCRAPAPAAWTCIRDWYDDGDCDCGCGVYDARDCDSKKVDSCDTRNCEIGEVVMSLDNAMCVQLPTASIDNASFELTPSGSSDVPGFVLVGRDGTASAQVVGPAQTDAPDGQRALRLSATSTSDPDFGFSLSGNIEVASSEFLPPEGDCTITLAIGDVDVDGVGRFGAIGLAAREVPAPLGLLALVELTTTADGEDEVSPPVDGYMDVEVSFYSDGEHPIRLQLVALSSYGQRSFCVDDIRITCE